MRITLAGYGRKTPRVALRGKVPNPESSGSRGQSRLPKLGWQATGLTHGGCGEGLTVGLGELRMRLKTPSMNCTRASQRRLDGELGEQKPPSGSAHDRTWSHSPQMQTNQAFCPTNSIIALKLGATTRQLLPFCKKVEQLMRHMP